MFAMLKMKFHFYSFNGVPSDLRHVWSMRKWKWNATKGRCWAVSCECTCVLVTRMLRGFALEAAQAPLSYFTHVCSARIHTHTCSAGCKFICLSQNEFLSGFIYQKSRRKKERTKKANRMWYKTAIGAVRGNPTADLVRSYFTQVISLAMRILLSCMLQSAVHTRSHFFAILR